MKKMNKDDRWWGLEKKMKRMKMTKIKVKNEDEKKDEKVEENG